MVRGAASVLWSLRFAYVDRNQGTNLEAPRGEDGALLRYLHHEEFHEGMACEEMLVRHLDALVSVLPIREPLPPHPHDRRIGSMAKPVARIVKNRICVGRKIHV
jgi:hypothetical protein